MLSVTQPVSDPQGRFVGVAGIDLALDQMQKIVSPNHLLEPKSIGTGLHPEYSFLASRSGLLIVHPDAGLLPHKGFDGAKLDALLDGKAAMSRAEGFGSVQIDGESRRVYWATAPLTGWKVVMNVSEAAILAPVNVLRTRALLLGLLSVALMVGLVYVIARRTARPILEISEAARGNTEHQVTGNGVDEVGQIADSFRALIAYQTEMARVAEAIAEGDLMQSITPKSDEDVLGHAFAAMVVNLRQFIQTVTSSANQVASASGTLAKTAQEVGAATEEITATMQEVALASEQSARGASEIAQGSTVQPATTPRRSHRLGLLR